MIEIRPFDRLGKANHGWLDTSYHFSFSGYHDPARMGWGALRVWNDDWIDARSGFPPHPHRDMEIVTYVRKGAISHRDSLGNEGRTAAGDVQVMSAGTGITHAEYNNEDEATELFQIWILPDRQGDEPRWGQRAFPTGDRAGRWVTLADGRTGAGRDEKGGTDEVLTLNADARLLAATLKPGDALHLDLEAGRHYYLVPVNGGIVVNGKSAGARDGVAITGETALDLTASDDVELVLVETR
ncbi:pirin family protein [Croceicoccus ponticola]|uniref:Pirin family protein n=1 Tax=Croceicoccus ponticola TaxID=2217664 RepID=A0A437H079_9SPHN|nr:pirin family protein [Croceicoccus ponticola]RVQ69016.1 pirin family protein [Croceicoccus ponticola]